MNINPPFSYSIPRIAVFARDTDSLTLSQLLKGSAIPELSVQAPQWQLVSEELQVSNDSAVKVNEQQLAAAFSELSLAFYNYLETNLNDTLLLPEGDATLKALMTRSDVGGAEEVSEVIAEQLSSFPAVFFKNNPNAGESFNGNIANITVMKDEESLFSLVSALARQETILPNSGIFPISAWDKDGNSMKVTASFVFYVNNGSE